MYYTTSMETKLRMIMKCMCLNKILDVQTEKSSERILFLFATPQFNVELANLKTALIVLSLILLNMKT